MVRTSSAASASNSNSSIHAMAMKVLPRAIVIATVSLCLLPMECHAFVATTGPATAATAPSATAPSAAAAIRGMDGAAAIFQRGGTRTRSCRTRGLVLLRNANTYDDWRADAVVPHTMHLDEDNVRACLDEFVESEYGTTMFGRHDRAASIGITGSIELVEVCGPEVTLSLDGAFWHRRSTVLGRAAVWLNARIPEITDVVVSDLSDLEDFEEIVDEFSGEVLFRRDKRSEDFNGDRATMEYQGLDPDARGPYPQSAMGSGGSMINPA